MGIENFLEDVLLVTLPKEPHSGDELGDLTEIASEGCTRDVIVDFSQVVMLTSQSLCALMILDKYIGSAGHQMVFCNMSPEIKHIFKRTGLVGVFTFADDEYSALQSVRRCSCLYR